MALLTPCARVFWGSGQVVPGVEEVVDVCVEHRLWHVREAELVALNLALDAIVCVGLRETSC